MIIITSLPFRCCICYECHEMTILNSEYEIRCIINLVDSTFYSMGTLSQVVGLFGDRKVESTLGQDMTV